MTMTDAQDEAIDPEKVRGWFHTYVEDLCICRYCGFDGSRSSEDWLQLQGDHLIPRNIAGENAESPLNRITSCYYCNTVKRNFDPSLGTATKVEDRMHQQELVECARQEIMQRKANIWNYGGGPVKSYEFMMRRLQK